jgi:hypothetical protein
MKLLRLCVALAALVSLAGCGDRKPEPDAAQAQADGPGVVDGAFFPHEGDAAASTMASGVSASASDSVSADPGDPALLNGERQNEAPRLKSDSAVAARQGDVLTIRIDGQPAARFTDQRNLYCEGYDSCSIWTYGGTVVVRDGKGAKHTLPVVYHFSGEDEVAVVVDRNGRIVWVSDKPLVSPSGQYLAAADAKEITDGTLHITDWFSPGHQTTVSFDGEACTPAKWTGPVSLAAECERDEGKVHRKMPATVTMDHGHWRLVEIVAPATKRKGKIKAKPQQTKVIDGKTDALPSQQQRAEADAYDRTAGYLRLATPDGP